MRRMTSRGREVFAGSLVGNFREAADLLLEEVAHFKVGKLCWDEGLRRRSVRKRSKGCRCPSGASADR